MYLKTCQHRPPPEDIANDDNERTPIIRRNSLYSLYLANQNYFEAMANRIPREYNAENIEMTQMSQSV